MNFALRQDRLLRNARQCGHHAETVIYQAVRERPCLARATEYEDAPGRMRNDLTLPVNDDDVDGDGAHFVVHRSR